MRNDGPAISVSLCFAQTLQELQRVQEAQRLVTAPPEIATPFLCDGLDPNVGFDVYWRRTEQRPERIAWLSSEFGQALVGKALLPSFKLAIQFAVRDADQVLYVQGATLERHR